MPTWEIKGLELEESVLKFLDGMFADHGVYVFMGLALLLIALLAWVLNGGLRRKSLRDEPLPHATPVIGVHIPIGRPASPPEPFDPFPPSQNPPDCDRDED